MADIPPILVEIQADVASLKKGLAEAQTALTGLNKKADESGGRFAAFGEKVKAVGVTLGIAFAGKAALNFLKSSVTEANAASAAQERLATLLTNTGGASEYQIQALVGQAEALESLGVVTKDNILVAQSQLATFDLTGSTIATLTPAILDYVTAEKGAAAGADDFRGMTNGLAQALQGNFASLTKTGFVLDEATKKTISSGTESERAAAIVSVLNSTYKGFNETLRDTNPLQAAINDLGKLKGDIGDALLPAIDQLSRFISYVLIPGIKNFTKFVKENAEAVKMLVIILGTGTAAFYAIRTGIIVTTTASKVFTAVLAAKRAGLTLTQIAVFNLRVAMQVLNATMRANPIGLIVTALALLSVAFVAAYKKSETFRNIVTKGVSIIVKGFALLLTGVGKFLNLLSKVPGMGWAKGIADGAQKAAEKLNLMANAMTKINQEEANRLAGVRTPYAGGTGNAFAGDTKGSTGSTGGGLADKEKTKLEGLRKKVKDVYSDMREVIAEASEKAAEALERRNERMTEAHERYNERVADLKERYNEQMAAADERFAERKANIDERFNEQMAAATERHLEAVAEARSRRALADIAAIKTYDKQKLSLEKNLQNKLADLRKNAAEKTADLTRKAAEKQAGIIKQSVDRLRNAFASKTGFSLTEAFGEGTSGEDILAKLTEKLRVSTNLAEKAEFLAANGFTQPFIEQVMAAGPEIGNELADAILQANPETIEQFKKTFNQLEIVSNTGMDVLAASMNTGANLATSELRTAYNQVAIDLKQSLNEVDAELTLNMAEQQAAFNEAMTAAAAVRDEKLAQNFAALTESIAKSDKALVEAQAKARADQTKALAEATAELTKARQKAQEDLNKGLVEAQKTLQKALIDAQLEYEKAIDKINEATQKKLEALKKKLAELAALISALAGAQAAASVVSRAPSYVPITPSTSSSTTATSTTATNVTVNATTAANPSAIASSVLSAIKYGNAVIPTTPTKLAAAESGAIGAASIRAQAPKLDQAYIAMRAR
jgi:hypothetical protein